MLRYFFEDERGEDGSRGDNHAIFQDLEIWNYSECMAHLGKYPVINLSLKSAKQPTYEMAHESLIDEVATEYQRHAYLLQGEKLSAEEKLRIERTISKKASTIENAKSLEFLSLCLNKYHQQKAIILIDEYDVPLENAYFKGFYTEMVDFIRSLLESALKTNINMEFAVITGCLRISRESIFTGLNNLDIYSLLNPKYMNFFGFTEKEVERMLADYEVQSKLEEVKSWYNGYSFGDLEIYNPWSVINYVKRLTIDSVALPEPFWSNTSSNSIVKELVENADFAVKDELEKLIEGKTVEKPIYEDITYDSIHESEDNLWSFLFFTGYLKKEEERQVDDILYLKLSIPNREIRSIYRKTVMKWFQQKMKQTDMSPLHGAIETGNCEEMEKFLSDRLLESISFFDYAENYYHGFLVGLLQTSPKYIVLSNRESGEGRSDIILKTPSVRGSAIIFEIKVAKSFQEMEAACRKALQQIESLNYASGLIEEGYIDIKKYAICFYRKECKVSTI